MIDDFLEKLAARTKAITKEGDYIKDGILHCGVCNEPKQGIYTLPNGRKITPAIMCRCEKEQEDRERKQLLEVEKLARKKDLMKGIIKSEKFLECLFENDDGRQPEITTICKKYVKAFPELRKKGYGMMLYGERDKGKSFYSCCIANALMENGYPVLFSTLVNLVKNQVEAYRGKVEEIDIRNYDLIIIDDLGVENATQTAFTVIDTIYSNKIPMIVTTNLSPTELKGTTIIEKGRIYNRILEMCPCKLLVKNNGSRAKKGNDNLKDMLDILG